MPTNSTLNRLASMKNRQQTIQRGLFCLMLFVIGFLPHRLALAGGSAVSIQTALKLLDQRSYVLIMRHAQTEPGIGDPPNFSITDCSTQRNLSIEGREYARQLGSALNPKRFDRILHSQWCRCADTASLMLPPTNTVAPWPTVAP